ncbi:MAG: hypothetical protein EON59_01670 [Alphaproteobacteria bacterium]|nr:MAG: hypothetical protein EON59_01670 [Alphaproteobacteria bacterium]
MELGEPTAALVRGDDYHRIVGAAFDRSVGALQEPPSAHDVERFYTLWLRWIAALDRWGTNPAIEYDLGFDGLHRWLSWIWGFKHDDDVFVLSFGLLNDVLDALSNADEPKSWFRPSCSNLIGSVYDVLTMPGLPSASVVWRGKSKAIRHRLVGDRASMVSELKSILTAACESENDSLIKVAMNTVQESLSRFSKSDRNPFDLPEIFQTYMDTGGHVSIGMALISYREDILRSTSDGNLSVAIGYLNSALDFIGKDVAPYSRKVLAECFSTILDQANNSALEEVRSIVVRRVRELEDCCPREDRAEFAANFGIRVSLAQAALRLGQRPLAWQELQKLDAALYKSPGWRGLTLSLLDVWRQFSAIDGQRALQRLRFWLRMFEGDYRFGASRLARDLMQETLFKSGSTSDSAWHLAEGIPTRPDFSLAMEHSQRGVMLELYCDAYRLCTLRSLELGEMARARLGLARLDGVIAEYSTASEPTLQYMKKVRSSLDHLPI